MKNIWNWIKQNPNRFMFLIPIILVAGISISHVVSWYELTNPLSWAIYLSVAIEVGAMTALIATTNKIKGGIWFMFGLVTLIQMIGNIFYSYKEIDANGELFKSWVELTSPIWESIGTESTDIIGLKRWLAFLTGGLLPIISLTSLHFFTNYRKEEEILDEPKTIEVEKIVEKEVPVEVIKEVEKIVEVPVEIIREVEKIVEKEVPVEVIKEVEKIVEVPVEVIKEVEKIVEVRVEPETTTTTTTTQSEGKVLQYTKP